MKDVHKTYRIRRHLAGTPRPEVFKALDGVNLQIAEGETLALLGPNGAGKSTLCRIAAGITKPTSGHALLDGIEVAESVRQVSERIGVVLGPSLVYHRLRGRHYLEFFAKLYRVPYVEKRISEVAASVDLEPWLDRYIESYSTGMMMRISLARALLHDPEFLILDEFTMGLDLTTAEKVRGLISRLGKTLLLTTHNPLEAEHLASKVAFITRGKISKVDSVDNIVRESMGNLELLVTTEDPIPLREALKEKAIIQEKEDNRISLIIYKDDVPDVLRTLSKLQIRSMEMTYSSLGEAFVRYTSQ